MIKKYRKKPVEIEAVLLTKDNFKDIIQWIWQNEGQVSLEHYTTGNIELKFFTSTGVLRAKPNKHYIVHDFKGEFYPIEREIFEETYEEVVR